MGIKKVTASYGRSSFSVENMILCSGLVEMLMLLTRVGLLCLGIHLVEKYPEHFHLSNFQVLVKTQI